MEQASWLDMKFELNTQTGLFSLFNKFSVSSKIVANANNDAAGQSKSDTVARDLTSVSIDLKILSTEKINAQTIAESWDAHLGDYAPLYISGHKFLFDNFQLCSCNWEPHFTPAGVVDSVSITLEFTEYAPEKAAKKGTPKTSASKSGGSKSTGKKPMDIDKDAVKKADARVNGYNSKVDVGASAADKNGGN